MPTVELFATARLLAGVKALDLPGASVRQVLRELAGKYPRLVGPVLEADGRPTAAYILNLNGARFLSDLDEPLQPADELLLMSSLSGG